MIRNNKNFCDEILKEHSKIPILWGEKERELNFINVLHAGNQTAIAIHRI